VSAAGIGWGKEFLAIGVDVDGARHAIYPTASRTLCGVSDDALDVHGGGDESMPDCLVCALTAQAYDRVDHSAPPAWFRNTAEVAA
jgi:hypothetical protein